MTVLYWALGLVAAVFLLAVFRGAPYVPSRRRDVERVFDELYHLQPHDVLVDIGSGDGKVCLAAAKRGARAVGYEINPMLVLIARWRARGQSRVQFLLRDFWRSELPEGTTIVYTFGDGRDIARMALWVEKQATRLRQPIYLLSYAFQVPDRVLTARSDIYFLYEIKPTLQTEKA